MIEPTIGTVVAVCRSAGHTFSKSPASSIWLRAGLGVDGDAHQGARVRHRSRVARDPSQPNLRQVHLIHEELFAELAERGFTISPGGMGENITSRNVAILDLPTGTRLHIGTTAVIEITGLRNPCAQLNDFQPGLLDAVLDRSPSGELQRKAGVMAIVITDGEIQPGDSIRVMLPPPPRRPLTIV